MAGRFSVTIKGADEIEQRLKELGIKALPAVQQAIMEGAKIVAEEAKSRVRKKTGALAESITVGKPKEAQLGEVSAIIGPGREGFYGMFLELGTSKMPAYPFLVPALKASKRQVEEAVAREIRKGLGL